MTINEIMMFVWLGVFVAMIIIELATVQLVSMWFACGALVTMFLTFIPSFPLWAQILVFIGVSAITLALVRPIAKKHLKERKVPSNIDALIGQKGKLIKGIDPDQDGEIRLGALLWTAKALKPDESIKEDSWVEVRKVEGNKVFVSVDSIEKEGK